MNFCLFCNLFPNFLQFDGICSFEFLLIFFKLCFHFLLFILQLLFPFLYFLVIFFTEVLHGLLTWFLVLRTNDLDDFFGEN